VLRLLGSIYLIAVLALASGCATAEPVWRARTILSLQQLEAEKAPVLAPEAFRNMQETFEHGEAIYRVRKNDEQADQEYRLAFQKGELLKLELDGIRVRQAEEARIKAEAELLRAEEQRKQREAAAEEQRRRELAAVAARDAARAVQVEQNGTVTRERPVSYSVRRGETLPQIAARPEIYNEPGLWPLIYRANRDQVRDPYQLWPGQVLKIPRSYSRDEAVEARRQASRR